ncbi:hypothetical protein [Streptomyces niveus]|uniref:hypothetical protein n=1 Tax=Streptomyces niveus TaxID=193462 RepID=UPI00107204E3|nr:hypothetical protein E4P36_28070 [Streptomyces sp. 4R-3d]
MDEVQLTKLPRDPWSTGSASPTGPAICRANSPVAGGKRGLRRRTDGRARHAYRDRVVFLAAVGSWAVLVVL